jgi:Zn-dependent peptidase ImmA (M78 family)
MNPAAIERWLSSEARELSQGKGVHLPRLVEALGIALRFDESVPTRDGTARRAPGGHYEIVVKASGKLSARVRFTIAHELGHVLIDKHYGIRPRTRGEYWTHEHLCDRFAAILLVPDAAASEFDATDPFESLRGITQRYGVSGAVAAQRVSELAQCVNFVSVVRTLNAAEQDVLRVEWTSGELFHNLKRPKHLKRDMPLGGLIFRFVEGDNWRDVARDQFSPGTASMRRRGEFITLCVISALDTSVQRCESGG